MKTNELYQLWKELNKRPETSLKEEKTTAFLMEYFKKKDFHPISFTKIPGFYVDIGSGKPIVGIRADMDALYQEVKGTWQANHSCGHDAHMAMITAVMFRVRNYIFEGMGTVRAIFQPAEEAGNGAMKVVKEGVADDLDYLFGVHVRPKNEISYPACAPGIEHGGCMFIKGEIKGWDHHGARPHEGVNAIEAGYTILQAIQQIHLPPAIPASIKMTNFHAGSDNLNIIPGKATFGLDVRAQSNNILEDMKQRVQEICQYTASLYHIEITLSIEEEVPAAVIDPEAEKILEKAIINKLGQQYTKQRLVTNGSDDFHFYTLLRPKIKASMLALGADVTPGLHHPNMTFKKEALENGTAILIEACLLALKQEQSGEGRETDG